MLTILPIIFIGGFSLEDIRPAICAPIAGIPPIPKPQGICITSFLFPVIPLISNLAYLVHLAKSSSRVLFSSPSPSDKAAAI